MWFRHLKDAEAARDRAIARNADKMWSYTVVSETMDGVRGYTVRPRNILGLR